MTKFNTMKYRIAVTLFFTTVFFACSYGQSDIASEKFSYIFKPAKNGGEIIYNGQNHYFKINVIGKNIKEAEIENSTKASNQNFFSIDNIVVQTSIVPLPQPLPASYNLSKLSSKQQKELLEGYVNYELDYFKNELNVNLESLKKEWKTINSQLYIFWYFEMPPSKDVDVATIQQIYVSTICFNQVLVINIPGFTGAPIEKHLPLATKLAESITMFNQAYDGK